MSSIIRIVIFGASGRMGESLIRLGMQDHRIHLVAAVTGRDVRPIAANCQVFSVAQMGQLPVCDVLIDFSQPEAFDDVLRYCREHKVALISGTTGLADAQRAGLADLAQSVPVLWASNFSLGVAVLNDLAARAAKALSDWNIEITETHHVHKKDAPSGTALTLGKAVEAAAGITPNYVSHREGEVIGDHLLQFKGQGETLELSHRALDRDIFARGALEAAIRLHSKSPGLYSFSELILNAT
jgi:4-hydroxy-tetrahydrodipicolinate reductase